MDRLRLNYRQALQMAALMLVWAFLNLTEPAPAQPDPEPVRVEPKAGEASRPLNDEFLAEKEPEPARPHPLEPMIASWYGEEFEGLETASGEIFDPELLTAAHKTLPLGTRLQVENPNNQERVEVVVNDRGPFISGRDLDLSARAFRTIANPNQGVIEVRVIVLTN